MISASKGLALRSLRTYKKGSVGIHWSINRKYSIMSGLKEINKKLDRFGDEDAKESKIALKVLRRLGGVSVIVVICLILWASTIVHDPIVEQEEIQDLSKDVRAR